ncbi:hypothetical protein [Mycolicibacterium sp. A43C]
MTRSSLRRPPVAVGVFLLVAATVFAVVLPWLAWLLLIGAIALLGMAAVTDPVIDDGYAQTPQGREAAAFDDIEQNYGGAQ